ncbi:PQQ-dependent sugar dehydrogenase [Adhaeribacter rhizoryzae]|nr:PQQ-dependent sugar dehydrogenase [Adhaeribacter rhizoryzae]
MKISSLSALLFCFLPLLGCQHKLGMGSNSPGKALLFTTPVETLITLDSTQIGVGTVASGLDVPWEMVWGPDNNIWFTEQGGAVSKLNPATGEKKIMLKIPDVYRRRSMGLLGMALHPDFKKSPYVFLDYTYLQGEAVKSRLVRYTYQRDTLTSPVVLLDNIPGANGHNGSRLVISPDNKIIMTTGDLNVGKNAQDKSSINGKILRMNLDGSVPADNPIPGSLVWSWGHRNAQGLVWGPNGNLYSSEHGDASNDELNLIQKSNNYGWPTVEGYCDQPAEKAFCTTTQVTEPLIAWTPVIAPAGIEFYNGTAIPEWRNAVLLTTLKTQTFRVLKLNSAGTAITKEEIYLDKAYGRLRDVVVSPAGDIYIATSNKDWNPAEGFPKPADDRIIRLYRIKQGEPITKAPVQIVAQTTASATPSTLPDLIAPGKIVYEQYCVSCHKKDGNGVAETFPPLQGAEQVLDKNALIKIVLHGLSGPVKVKGVEYNQQMPAFTFLSDKNIAEVLTYVRYQFGNKASAVAAEEVKNLRTAGKN